MIRALMTDLFARFQTSFYSDPADAVFKALGGSEFDVRLCREDVNHAHF
jgi:hypothetical protein